MRWRVVPPVYTCNGSRCYCKLQNVASTKVQHTHTSTSLMLQLCSILQAD